MIKDDELIEMIRDAAGNTRRDPAFVAWQKNRAETRMRLLAKWAPRKYGDTQKLELTGKDGGAIADRKSTRLNSSHRT